MSQTEVWMACIFKPDLQTSNSCHSYSLCPLQFCKTVLSTSTVITCFTEQSIKATQQKAHHHALYAISRGETKTIRNCSKPNWMD